MSGKEKVVVAMSGGVDSSVAAYILKEQGYEVIGVTMAVIPKYVCNGIERTESIINDAKKVANKLDIEHHVLDLRENFEKKVIDLFVSEYKSGRTPNPCVACNGAIKFGDLFDYAIKDLGAKWVVTGHYAEISEYDSGKRLLKKGEDSRKDQSYFLYNIKRENLKYLKMPLKNLSKDEVREIARKIDLDIAKKPDSEEICFIPDDDHSRFIREDLNIESQPGDFIDSKGNILGKHKGIINYTIGQRRGLGVSLGKRVYVQDIIPETNQVVLGSEEGLFKTKLYANEINLLSIDKLPEEMEVMAKIRYAAKESPAIVKPYKNGMLVEFKEPQRAITKGQSVVLYDGDIVIGGGIVEKVY